MKIEFTLPIPISDRFKILWNGGLYVHVTYRGNNKPLTIEARVPTSREMRELREARNANKNRSN